MKQRETGNASWKNTLCVLFDMQISMLVRAVGRETHCSSSGVGWASQAALPECAKKSTTYIEIIYRWEVLLYHRHVLPWLSFVHDRATEAEIYNSPISNNLQFACSCGLCCSNGHARLKMLLSRRFLKDCVSTSFEHLTKRSQQANCIMIKKLTHL